MLSQDTASASTVYNDEKKSEKVIIFLQQLTFRRCAAKYYLFLCAFDHCDVAVYWYD